jgi:tetratricopeptide (TPR) repeat protein
MMKPRYTLVALAVTTVLAACSGTAEKKDQVASMEMTKPAAVETQAPPAEAKKEVVAVPEVKPVEAKPVAPAEAPKPAAAPEPAPVAKPAPAAEAPKPALKIPTDPNTFLITASTKTHQHPYYGRGKNIGFNVNGVPGRDVVVTRGQTYKFVVDTGVQHDFYLTTSAAGWGAGTYTDGVTGQFIYKGTVTFKPNSKTPDLLYYECRNHKYMGGKIYVLDKGEDLAKVKAAVDAKVDEGASRQHKIQVSESSVKQKLSYAQMVLGSSSAKRVEASGNSHAIGVLNNARSKIGAAKASLGAGQLDTAMEQVNEGLRLLTAASREITSESEMSGVDYKARYDELTKSLQNYDKSYQRHLKRAKQPPKNKLDEAEYKRLVEEGHSLAGKEDYAGASKSLEKAQNMITSVLTDMLHAQTVTYDKKFETPKEEYEYELARLESYEELIPIAIEQKQPSERAIELINSFVKKADKIKGEGQDVAAKGDYKMAIMAMQAATSNLQRALRMAGVH